MWDDMERHVCFVVAKASNSGGVKFVVYICFIGIRRLQWGIIELWDKENVGEVSSEPCYSVVHCEMVDVGRVCRVERRR